MLSRAPHTISSDDISSAVTNGVEIHLVDYFDFKQNYVHDQFLGPILQALKGVLAADEVSRRQINWFYLCSKDEGLLRYENKLCFHEGKSPEYYIWHMILALEVISDTQKQCLVGKFLLAA
jgi:hypothetical protein